VAGTRPNCGIPTVTALSRSHFIVRTERRIERGPHEQRTTHAVTKLALPKPDNNIPVVSIPQELLADMGTVAYRTGLESATKLGMSWVPAQPEP